MNVGARMFKDPSLMGIFHLPPPSPTTTISPINMIFVVTNGSLGFVDPWVVAHYEDVESYGESMPLIAIEIVDPKIPSTYSNTGHKMHPPMECVQPTPPIWVVDSLNSHESLDFDLYSEEAILEFMDSIDNPREGEHHG